MMIGDVILEASSEHEIFFLLTAYVESLRYCDKRATLPEALTRLPLSGLGDVRNKLEGINAEIGRSAGGTAARQAVLSEAADIFATALERLKRLAEQAALHADGLLAQTA